MSKIKDFLKSPLGTVLCAAAACLLAVVLVWLAAVRPNNDKSLSERISDDYSQYSAELDEANGAAQTFDTDNDLLAMAFVFGTSNGQPTGELHLELADADTGLAQGISLLYRVSRISWQSAICSSRTAMPRRGNMSRKICSAMRWDCA